MDKSIKPKEFQRDLTTQLKFPTISWSSMNAFMEYDREAWYKQYCLGIKGEINPAMEVGISIGERIIVDKKFLPQLPRPEIFEKHLSAVVENIKITGHLDGWSPSVPEIKEFKTTQNKKRWNQKSVDQWGQLTMYTFLVYINYNIRPENLKLSLISIPIVAKGDFSLIQEGEIEIFNTKRSMLDMLNFIVTVKKVHAEMVAFVANKKGQP